MESNENMNRRKEPRANIKTDVEFIITADIIQAMSMDISSNGIRLDTKNPLEIELRIKHNGSHEDRQARLCWVREREGGGFTLGFEFVD